MILADMLITVKVLGVDDTAADRTVIVDLMMD